MRAVAVGQSLELGTQSRSPLWKAGTQSLDYILHKLWKHPCLLFCCFCFFYFKLCILDGFLVFKFLKGVLQ